MKFMLEFDAGDPALDGHFPGDPIVPGAVLLDAAIGGLGLDGRTGRLRDAKFLLAVRPGDRLTVEARPVSGGMKFEGRFEDGRLALCGTVAS